MRPDDNLHGQGIVAREPDAASGLFRTKNFSEVGFSSPTANQAEELLGLMRNDAMRTFVQQLRSGEIRLSDFVRRDLSREVNSHFKWCIGSKPGFSLWLNEYKSAPQPGHATTVHNHRYSFASTVVFGSLQQRQYSIVDNGKRIRSITLEAEFVSNPDDSYSVDHELVHQVTGWAPGTATLVLKGPVEAGMSQVFDLESFEVRDTWSMSALFPLLGRHPEIRE